MSHSTPAHAGARQRSTARLFTCGDAQNARRAKENLQRLRETHPYVEFTIEIVDVDQDPQTALDHGIFMNPALQVIEPAPGLLLYGDLSDLRALESMISER